MSASTVRTPHPAADLPKDEPPRPDPYVVLVADDEEDVHHITRIALRPLVHNGRRLRILSAHSAAETLRVLQREPEVAVLLLDVVMESDHAGLDACRAIREELGNAFVRILLRTGQPGRAPEEAVVRDYGIDGYLPKADLTSLRLTTMIRTALKSYDELVALESRRSSLESVHESVREISGEGTWAGFREERAFDFGSGATEGTAGGAGR
ncbi:response regulator [Streptomyces sp. NPDC005805]|uniref:response regulator n=1 Tax=Streptomyces sp. NPDC005805 TaxID=3157068 RepID=UPI0033F40512